ncbi:MAG: hypothetical protein K0R51_1201 [Cytophagaceae bacterium]|jgi:hypothetical protein|nr:hypothetical protein [Cytophagaceae bacterium]
MSKKLRQEPIYIAPEIIGWLDENFKPIVYDERNKKSLNPTNIHDKITIYERQVNDWFLLPAKKIVDKKNHGFIVLMICMSYLEGVEQYHCGKDSKNQSRAFFISSLKRIYPNSFNDGDLNTLYKEARCGLFHSGMVQGKIVINNTFDESIRFQSTLDIKINPKKLLYDIENDFNIFIQKLRADPQARELFGGMYSNI